MTGSNRRRANCDLDASRGGPLRPPRRSHLLDTVAGDLLDGFTRLAARATGKTLAVISLIEEDRQCVKSQFGTEPDAPLPQAIPRELSLCAQAVLHPGTVFEIEDARRDPRFRASPLVRDPHGIAHYAGVALLAPGGESIGTLCVADREPGRLGAAQRELLRDLASQLVQVLLLGEQERSLERDKLLHDAVDLSELAPEHLPCGLTVTNDGLHPVLINETARLRLEDERAAFEADGADAAAVAPRLAASDRVQIRKSMSADRNTATPSVVEVRGATLPGGGVIATFTDVTAARQAALDLHTGTASTRKILVAEDNEVNQYVVRRMLELIGHSDVCIVADGEAALDACSQHAFDLILMDCQMPRLDGLSATEELRRRGVRTPVIAFTATATSTGRDDCLRAGMNDYVTKPVELAVLQDKVQRWVGRAIGGTSPAHPPGMLVTAPAFDPDAVTRCFAGHVQTFRQVRDMFIGTTRQRLTEISLALRDARGEAAARIAHQVKGGARTLGAERLAQLCQPVEDGALAPGLHGEWAQQARAALEAFVLECEDARLPAHPSPAPAAG